MAKHTSKDLTKERRLEIRRAIAREIVTALVLGAYQDAACAAAVPELHYIESVVDDLTRRLRED